MSTEPEFDSQSHRDLARLRHTVAGLIKNILAARAMFQPEWCEKNSIDQDWFRSTPRPTTQSATYLLEHAAQGLHRYQADFAWPPCSVSYWDEDDETPTALVDALNDLVCQFVRLDELREAANVLWRCEQQSFKWDDLCKWELLPQLRSLLDRLPDHSNQLPGRIGDQRLSADAQHVYSGDRRLDCPPRVHGLLYCLLGRPNRACALTDLAEPIWKDHALTITTARIDDVLTEARKWFRKQQLPFNVRRAGSDVRLIEESPHSST